MRSLLISTLWVGFFCSIIFFGVKCQKDNELKDQLDQSIQTDQQEQNPDYTNEEALSPMLVSDTTYVPITYGGALKVYPRTIVKCYNKKTKAYEYQALMFGNEVLPACKHQQLYYHDKVNVSDTGVIYANDTFYLCRRVIK